MKQDRFFSKFPYLKEFFSFPSFNNMQEACIETIMNTNDSMVVSAPTSSGKTVLFELAIIKGYLFTQKFKAVYLAPIKSLCQQKFKDWKSKFPKLHILELTGDTNQNSAAITAAQIIIATPQKLDYLTRSFAIGFEISLLLVDEIHMVSVEVRGATLEAVVTRLQLKWKNLRTIAISATIANIDDISQWLKVSDKNTKQFGQEYRPVRVDKVVIGYRPSKNPYLFECSLNNKLYQIIIRHSQNKSSLVFCQTQKGTVSACQKLINTLNRSYLIRSDRQSNCLTKCSKKLTDKTLSKMVLCGVAFHNASLTVQDRNIIIQQFLQENIKIICTTSTLAQGMNLPARLAIIKGTVTYRGAGKGYEQYTGAELEQMMGRAGRLGFDERGTAVIMTENFNVNKYSKQLQKDDLQSQFGDQIKEHVNVEISLRNLRNFEDVMRYLKSTFLYVRMGKCPQKYGISKVQQRDLTIKRLSEEAIQELLRFELIYENKGQIHPLQLCVELSKSTVSFTTTKHLLSTLPKIKSFQEFITMMCEANEIQKFKSKLTQRKCLKELNMKNRFKIKQTIASASKKAFILFQALMSQYSIGEWELDRQAKEIAEIIKNTLHILRNILKRKKYFLPSCYCHSMLRFINKGCWNYPEDLVLSNFYPLKQKAQIMKQNNIDTLEKLQKSLTTHCFAVLCHQPDAFNDYILNCIDKYTQIWVSTEKKEHLQITIHYQIKFSQEIKSIRAIVGSGEQLEVVTDSNIQENQIKVYLKKYHLPIRIFIILDNTLGFDKSFIMEEQGQWKQVSHFDYQDGGQKSLKDYPLSNKKQSLNSPEKNSKRKNRKVSTESDEYKNDLLDSTDYKPRRKPQKYQPKLLKKIRPHAYHNLMGSSEQKLQDIRLCKLEQLEFEKLVSSPRRMKPCIVDEPIPFSSSFDQYSYSAKKRNNKPLLLPNEKQKEEKLVFRQLSKDYEDQYLESKQSDIEDDFKQKQPRVTFLPEKQKVQVKEGDWEQMFRKLTISKNKTFFKGTKNNQAVYDEMYRNL